MTDYSVALGVQAPQSFDASRAFSLAAQIKGQEFNQEQELRRQAFAEQQSLHSQKNEDARLAMAQSEAAKRNSLLQMQLQQQQGGQNALAEYSKDTAAPGAVDKLSRYPEIQSQVLQVRSQMGEAEKQQFDQKLLRNGRRAQYVSGFEGDAKKQAWQDSLKDALAHGDISQEQAQQYAASEPNDLLLHNVMSQAVPIQQLYQETAPTPEMRNLKAAGIEPTSPEGKGLLTGMMPKFEKTPDGRLIRIDPTGKEDPRDVTPAANENSQGMGGRLSEEAAQSIAERYVTSGDRMQLTNLGRGGIGDANRAKVQENITRMMSEQGISNEELANRAAEWEGRKAGARTLGTQEARMGSAAFEAGKMIELGRTAIDKVPRTSFLPWNKMVQAYQNQTLNPDQRELFARTQAIVNTYSAVMARGASVTTDSVRHRSEELLSTAFDKDTYKRVLDVMEQEIDAAKNSPETMREFYRKKYGNNAVGPAATAGGGAPGAAPAGAGAAKVKVNSADEARQLIQSGKLKKGDHFTDENGIDRVVH